jgi:hypothetical protein
MVEQAERERRLSLVTARDHDGCIEMGGEP